jgi:hypothetical protein
MNGLDIDTWNISKILESGSDTDERIKNTIENINQKLKLEFTFPHPNIFHFINVIRRFS